MHTGDWIALAIGLLHAAIAIVAAVYIAGNRKPSSAIAWIMAIVFIPYVGILFFLLIGSWRLPQHRRDKQAHVSRIFLERTEGLHLASHPTQWPDWLPTIVALNRTKLTERWWLRGPIALYAGWLTAASFVSLCTTLAGYDILLNGYEWAFVGILGALAVAIATLHPSRISALITG